MIEICETPLQIAQYLSSSPALTPQCTLSLLSVAETGDVGVADYAILFSLTIALEAAFYFGALAKASWSSRFKALVLCNLATHPAVVFIVPRIFASLQRSRADELIAAEFFAPFIEALLLVAIWKTPPFRAALFMVIGNLFSWWVGLEILSRLY